MDIKIIFALEMSMFRLLILITFLVWALTIKAQDSLPGPVQLDRPDQTECPFIVPSGYFQMENGGSFEQVSDNISSIIHPTSLWKFGLNDNSEFRLITEFNTIKIDSFSSTGLSPVTIGFKTKICEENGIIPKTSFIGHLTLPALASKDLEATYYAPAFRFTMQHTLSDRLCLAYNLGAEWDGETAEPTFIYTLTSGLSITDRMGFYAELYGFIPQIAQPDHRFDCGFVYSIGPGFIIDLSGGAGLSENSPQWYVALGVSFRFKVAGK